MAQEKGVSNLLFVSGCSPVKLKLEIPNFLPAVRISRLMTSKMNCRAWTLPGFKLNLVFLPRQMVSADMQQIASLLPKKSGMGQIRSWLIDGKATGSVRVRSSSASNSFASQVNSHASPRLARETDIAGRTFGTIWTSTCCVYQKEEMQTDPMTKIVAIIAWKDEMSQEHWAELVRAPVKSLQTILKTQQSSIHLHAAWGVSYQNQGKACSKHEAESIQVHATIHESQLPTILRVSGFQGLYCTPKGHDGIHTDDWKTIWLPIQVHQVGSHAEAMRQLSKVEEPYGIIRSKTNFGLRSKRKTLRNALHSSDPKTQFQTPFWGDGFSS